MNCCWIETVGRKIKWNFSKNMFLSVCWYIQKIFFLNFYSYSFVCVSLFDVLVSCFWFYLCYLACVSLVYVSIDSDDIAHTVCLKTLVLRKTCCFYTQYYPHIVILKDVKINFTHRWRTFIIYVSYRQDEFFVSNLWKNSTRY